MRSEYAANLALSTPSRAVHRQTPNTRRMARTPERRTFWGWVFFWL